MTLRCAVLDDYQDAALRMADWSGLGGRVAVTTYQRHLGAADDVVTALQDYDMVVAMRERTPFPAGVLARLPRLRLLVTTGMRNTSIDLEAAQQHGVTVSGTASRPDPPAELTWALILGLARHLVTESTALRADGPWQSTIGTDLAGRTLGLLGLGKIGTRVARVGRAFGMDVVAWSQHLTRDRTDAEGARLAESLEELLGQADFVSVHLVLSDRTKGLLDDAALREMRPSAYLVNTSRAAIVDQTALIEALEQDRLAGAGLDVYELEPLPARHPLRTLPNVLATPHVGYVTRDSYAVYYDEAVEDIEAYLSGSPLRVLT